MAQSKIQRAIAESTAKRHKQLFAGLRSDVRALLAAAAKETGELAIVVHFYSGPLETERFVVQKGRSITAEELETTGCEIGEDQLLLVRRE
jgi:hypothetical protein